MITGASFDLTNFENLFFNYRLGLAAYLLEFSPFMSIVYTFFKTDYISKNSKENTQFFARLALCLKYEPSSDKNPLNGINFYMVIGKPY